jgi:hypothetical protein
MLRWLSRLFPSQTSEPHSQKAASVDPSRLEHLLRTPGRAHHSVLISFAHSVPLEEFVAVVHCHALVGSAIREGELSKAKNRPQDLLSSATFQFSPAEVSAFLEGRSIEQTIFLLRKEPHMANPSPSNRFTIGRAKNNDIRIVDFAISRLHAMIEYSSGGYLLRDCDSRNGTKINGRRIHSAPEPLSDRDVVSLGRYEFTFLEPQSLYERLVRVDLAS